MSVAACGNVDVIGSETELRERAVEGWQAFAGHTPHRPWIDEVKIACSACGETVSRIKDVGNPWLDAGIVPFSTLRYRHDREYWEEWFPAEMISESFPGQFRNWFYSMIAQSTALVDRPPFLNVFSYALMRDEKGEEMHKSKGNAIWFDEAAEEIGVDAMRWLFSRANPDANLNFGYHIADEVRRRFILPLWNSYAFFATYAALDRFDPHVAENQSPTRRAHGAGPVDHLPTPPARRRGPRRARRLRSRSRRAGDRAIHDRRAVELVHQAKSEALLEKRE